MLTSKAKKSASRHVTSSEPGIALEKKGASSESNEKASVAEVVGNVQPSASSKPSDAEPVVVSEKPAPVKVLEKEEERPIGMPPPLTTAKEHAKEHDHIEQILVAFKSLQNSEASSNLTFAELEERIARIGSGLLTYGATPPNVMVCVYPLFVSNITKRVRN